MTSRLLKYILPFVVVLATMIPVTKLCAQDFFIADSWGNVYKSSISTCVPVKLASCGTVTEIAYYKDTLYTIIWGSLYKTLASNPTNCTYVTSFQGATNSLTVDSAGTVYAANEYGLYSYQSSTGITRHVGRFPVGYYPSGDLSFYKGKLYMATNIYSDPFNSYLVEINLENPSLSTPFMKLQSKNVFGCITLPKTCDTNGFYITGQENNASFLREVDMENKVELARKCVYDLLIWGVASYTESGTTNRPQIDSIVKTPACSNEGNNGSIKIFTGITGSKLTYKINNATPNNTGVFTGLKPGVYTISISSEQGCLVDTTVTVLSATSPAVSSTSIQPTCTNSDGKIIVEPVSTGMSMKYSINGNEWQNSGAFVNLNAGDHIITAANESGCTVQQHVQLKLPTIDTTQSSITIINSTCHGSNGSILVKVPNAVQPVTYFLNNITTPAPGYFPSLKPSEYLVSITDANGCRFDTSINIQSTPVPVIDSIVSPVLCGNGNDNGSIRIYAKNSNDTFTYSLNNSLQNHTGIFSSLYEGKYLIKVTNQSECSTDTAIVITKVNVPSFLATLVNPTCKGNDGTIVVRPLFQDENIKYSLNGNNYSVTDSFKNLSAGSYTITSKNAAGCTAQKTVTLTSLSTNSIRILSVNPICSANNGSIQVAVQNLKEPVSYKANGIASATGSFTNLAASLYKVNITDGNGCAFDTSVVLTTNPLPVIDSVNYRDNCTNEPGQGEISIFPKNNGEAFTYSMNASAINQTGHFTNLNAGIYSIRVSDKNHCATDTTVNIAMITSPSFSASITNPTCAANDGRVTVRSLIDGMDLKYSINQSTYENKQVFDNLGPGSYKITALNQGYCSAEKTAELILPTINKNGIIVSTENTKCNQPNGTIKISTRNVTAPVTYFLNGSMSATGAFNNLNASSYKLSVTDGNACSFDTTIGLSTIAVIKPKTEFTKVQPTCPGVRDGSISLSIFGSQEPYIVSVNNSLFTATRTFLQLKQDSYDFIVKNAENCLVDSFTIQLAAPPNAVCSSIYFPNAFTPNGDGKNDLFRPSVYGLLETYTLSIFGRMGQKVAEFKDPKQAWDGTINGIPQNTGTFVWFCTYKFYGAQQQQSEKGTIVLMR